MTAQEIYYRQHELYAKRIRPLFLRALNNQVAPAIEAIRSGIEPNLDIMIKGGVFIRPMVQAYEMIGLTASRHEYYVQRGEEDKGAIDFLVNTWRAIFRLYAERYAYRIDNEMSEKTRQSVRDAIALADERGYNADERATLIRQMVQGQINRQRATLIAVTEATTASNLGKVEGAKTHFKETNQNGYKQWVGRNDGRERASHIQMNDDIIPVDDLWQVANDKGGIDTGNAPGATTLSVGNRARCRCTQVFMSERRYRRMLEGK